MPRLNTIHEKYAEKGLVLIGFHSDPDTGKGMGAVATLNIKYPVAYDGGDLMKKFHCEDFPDYVIIDRKGIVRVVDLAGVDLEKAIETLLKEKPDK